MTSGSVIDGKGAAADVTFEAVLRERDDLFRLHEALADVARATSAGQRMSILVDAVRQMGYGRATATTASAPLQGATVVARIGGSVFLDTGELMVPVCTAGGFTLATLVLADPAEPGVPSPTRVRAIELFGQQVASIIEHTRLVESASDAIFTVASDGTLTATNPALERASGVSRECLLGTSFLALADPRDRTTAWKALAEAFSGQRSRVDLRYAGPRGDVRHCSLTLTPLNDGTTVTAALGVVRDVTDERRLAEQLLQQEKLAAVGQLVSGVAHELNNPLASVMAFAQLLLAAPPDMPSDRDALDAINQEARRAAKIVSNLLTFARQRQPEHRVADLNRVVEDTLDLRRYAMRIAEVDVVLDLDPDLPATWADPFQLQQVVLNLITNAEQAVSRCAVPRMVEISTARSGDTLIIRVSDNGPGVAPEHRQRVFNPFFTTKPVGEGTGLGLSISDGIVREHGGRIRLESSPATSGEVGSRSGATFVVELPHVEPPPLEASPPASPLALAEGAA